jgi:hypothetical protein
VRNDTHLTTGDLLRLVDADLPPDELSAAHAHVAVCASCRRHVELLADVDQQLTESASRHDVSPNTVRRSERLTLALRNRANPRLRPSLLTAGVSAQRVAMLAAALVLATAGTVTALRTWRVIAPVESTRDTTGELGSLPIRRLTPGATVALPAAELCRQMPVEPSPISADVRHQVLHAYGMEDLPEHEYELDYLVTPDLGGAPDPRNLWPEPYGVHVWNARVKDELETLLPRLVCEGKVDLSTAQQDIATDWIAAYKKYFGTDRPIRLYSNRTFAALEP